MNIQIQTIHFDADSKLINHVNERLDKLSTYHDSIVSVEVYLKLDNIAHQIKDKIAEVKVHVPKHEYFVKHESKSFEESFNTAFDSVVNKLKKEKEKNFH